MGGLFSKPKSIKSSLPPVPEPPPSPDAEGGGEPEEFAKRRQLRKRGRRQTFITGALVPEATGKKTVLG